MKSQEVRLGNYYFYHIVDKYDERGEYDEVCQIDAEDFRILENFDCPEYKPIPLTEEWLLKFGFEKFIGNNILWGLADFCVGWYGNKFATWIIRMQQENNEMNFHSQIKYVHQLQNLYFALTGEELIVSSNRNNTNK